MTTIATQIRNAAFDRLTAVPIGDNWKVAKKIPIPTLQQDQLPCLSVYVLRETLAPDGDANVSVPRYISDTVISFSVFESADKAETIEGVLDTLVDIIQETLLTDPTFLGMLDSNGTPIIEEVTQMQRNYFFPQNGENYYMELRLQMSFKFRCFFEPQAPNAFTEVDVTVVPFKNATQSGDYTEAIPLPQ